MDLLSRTRFFAGPALIVMTFAIASLPLLGQQRRMQLSLVSATQQEGRATTILGKVEYLRAESEGRIQVAISPYAQLFFVARADPDFEKWVALLKEAKDRRQRVKCTVRRYSGRIEHVTVER
jgi:hypothetical protein